MGKAQSRNRAKHLVAAVPACFNDVDVDSELHGFHSSEICPGQSAKVTLSEYSLGERVLALRSNGSWSQGIIMEVLQEKVIVALAAGTKAVRKELAHQLLMKLEPEGHSVDFYARERCAKAWGRLPKGACSPARNDVLQKPSPDETSKADDLLSPYDVSVTTESTCSGTSSSDEDPEAQDALHKFSIDGRRHEALLMRLQDVCPHVDFYARERCAKTWGRLPKGSCLPAHDDAVQKPSPQDTSKADDALLPDDVSVTTESTCSGTLSSDEDESS